MLLAGWREHLCGGLLGNDDRTVTFSQIKPAKINLSLFGGFLERLFGL